MLHTIIACAFYFYFMLLHLIASRFGANQKYSSRKTPKKRVSQTPTKSSRTQITIKQNPKQGKEETKLWTKQQNQK